MSLDEFFDSPLKTIAWAREAIDELDTGFRAFFDTHPYRDFMDVDPDTGERLHKIALIQSLPSVLERKATEALNNIRHSFDQSLFAGCCAIGKRPKKDIAFPWKMSPTDLNFAFTDSKGKVPTEFRDVIHRQEPYPASEGHLGGNDQIRELAKIANGKHTIGLTVTIRISVSRISDFSGGYIDRFSIPGTKWDSLKNEVIIAIIGPKANVRYKHQFALRVVLDIPGPLGDVPIIDALREFANKSEVFHESIKAECRKIVS